MEDGAAFGLLGIENFDVKEVGGEWDNSQCQWQKD
jgi:hypothetical protein